MSANTIHEFTRIDTKRNRPVAKSAEHLEKDNNNESL